MNLIVTMAYISPASSEYQSLPKKKKKTQSLPQIGGLSDPMIGTGGEGHTFPGAVAPFGMVQLSPDTDATCEIRECYGHASGYRYDDPTIQGFSHTHFSGAGHSDLGDFLMMPAVGDDVKLEPGDAIFFPALWWHQVEALAPFNILMNYWWNDAPAFMDSPMNTLLHGLLSLRDRPEAEKQGWRALFEYYVFGDAGGASAHLPEGARGPLGPLDAMSARRLRAQLLHRLNR